MKRSNKTNQVIYRLWAPIYDFLLEWFFAPGRRRAHQLLDLKADEEFLIVGIGTGNDLRCIPDGIAVVGIDLSWAMLKQAQKKAESLPHQPLLVIADAGNLPFSEAQFDAAMMNLILSVVPQPRLSFREAMRTLGTHGRGVVFDKFLPEDQQMTLLRKMLNVVTELMGTDINRRFEDIIEDADCEVLRDEPVMLNGAYRAILMRL
ncbi:MAG: methyltransferase domain-containing protein [Chloroflexi bacterium]|nr:MAG: methyltransferase domain-containing protein [Chloroflexota bacterium]MBL1193877.1 methyltransferase domain-containing protein [Chloroflexota bacterium]NOH11171.1 methyltransferase domain-containing protein [Chloroflexota bacterium]